MTKKTKTVILSLLFFLVFFHPTQKVVAQEKCNTAGGSCYEGLWCPDGYTDLGASDCPQTVSGDQKWCCKKGPQGCRTDYSTCQKNEDCCSQRCEYDNHRKSKICYLLIVTVTPAPPSSLNITCDNGNGIYTALGCIPANDLTSFVGWLLGVIVPVAAGIAFLLMASGAFQIITSAGDPKKVQAGQELITSALSGLLFIILSLFLLKLIGVDILHIPGF